MPTGNTNHWIIASICILLYHPRFVGIEQWREAILDLNTISVYALTYTNHMLLIHRELLQLLKVPRCFQRWNQRALQYSYANKIYWSFAENIGRNNSHEAAFFWLIRSLDNDFRASFLITEVEINCGIYSVNNLKLNRWRSWYNKTNDNWTQNSTFKFLNEA